MSDYSAAMAVLEADGRHAEPAITAAPTAHTLHFVALAVAAFGIYWLSAMVLENRGARQYFGADYWWYAKLAHGEVIGRIARFHPLTIGMALAWMKIFAPLTAWITEQHLLNAMFAAIGAAGCWAATRAFAAVMPHRYALLWGMIYASTFGIWYFASIEESKITTAALTAFYIAFYLQLRENWTLRGAWLLAATLFLACLNEITACFLVIIPLVDTFVQRGWNWRHYPWIVAHALVAPFALGISEGVVSGWLVARETDPDGASQLSMFLQYLSWAKYSLTSLYGFACNWLFFNIAAPTANAPYYIGAGWKNGGYFEPVMSNYFSSPVSAAVIILLGAIIAVAVFWPRDRIEQPRNLTGLMLALAAYTLMRATFFFIFNPPEPLLFSTSVTLAYLLMVGIPFTAARFPEKDLLLTAFLTLLLVSNSTFIMGRCEMTACIANDTQPTSSAPSPSAAISAKPALKKQAKSTGGRQLRKVAKLPRKLRNGGRSRRLA